MLLHGILFLVSEISQELIKPTFSILDIVVNLPIPQADRKRLKKQIDLAELYQKINHMGHCLDDVDCVTHCTRFGLSDPSCPNQYIDCTRQHETICKDCLNVILTLDEVEEKIKGIHDEELRREVAYDFENSVQHIHEWFRHNVRASQQSHQKVKIISSMLFNEAFATFDWAQKVLPQEHREGQSSYFGKSGMSLLIGSFLWKEKGIVSSNGDTPNEKSAVLRTQSYILALTTATQSELDTLSASEIILRQFKEDNPFIDAMYKRTDNASNFSSNSTPEVEKLICDRVSYIPQLYLQVSFSFKARNSVDYARL